MEPKLNELITDVVDMMLCPLEAHETAALKYRRQDAQKITAAVIANLDKAGYAIVPTDETIEASQRSDKFSVGSKEKHKAHHQAMLKVRYQAMLKEREQ